jgi:hypothetical protein
MSDIHDKVTDSALKPGRTDSADEPRGQPARAVEYTLTVEDVAAFLRHHTKHPPRGTGRVGLPEWPSLLLMGVALVVLLLRQLLRPGPFLLSVVDWALVVFVLGYFVLYFFGKPLRRYLRLRALRHNPRYPERRTLAITAEALMASNPSSATTVLWHALPRIEADAEHAFFYLAPSKAIILPRRAFADDRQFAEFVDTARRYHAEVRRFVRTEGQA